MGKLITIVALASVFSGIFFIFSSSEGVGVTVNEGVVLVETRDFEIEFKRDERVDETYMIFGGATVPQHNAINKITLAGLRGKDARRIARRYPDFHRCASPGAALARPRVKQLDIVPADAEVLDRLEQVLDEFNGSIQDGGDRVCIRVEGAKMKLETATVREVGEDFTKKLPELNWVLVTRVDIVPAKSVLRRD